MPAVAEKEEIAAKIKLAVPRKFQELEAARNYLFSAVAADEDSPDSIIFNVQIIALSITARLQNLSTRLRKIISENKEMAEMLDEMVSKEETAELVPSKKIARSDVKEAAEAAVNQAIKEARMILQSAMSEMERYELVTSQYFVKIAGKYAYLLVELKKASAMLGRKQVEIDAIYAEYKEYYRLHSIIKSAILGNDAAPGWVKLLRKKTGMAEDMKSFEDIANSFDLFIASNKKQIDGLGELIKLQSDLRFKKVIELTDGLLAAAREYA